jgi:hypothetical protein
MTPGLTQQYKQTDLNTELTGAAGEAAGGVRRQSYRKG